MGRTLSFKAILAPSGVERDRRLDVDEDGTIVSVGAGGPPYDGFLALPGMVNAHSHAFQRALVGLGEAARGEDSFWSWREEMYRLAARIEPEELYAVARQAYGEMLVAGFTRVVEFHHLHHRRDGGRGPETAEAVRRAASDAGLPMTFLPVYYRTRGFDGAPARPEQRRFIHDSVDGFLEAVSRLQAVAGVAPHSLRAVPGPELVDLVEGVDALLGREAPLHIHIAEQEAEVAECRDRFGRPPVARLAELVELGPRWGLVHATHATPGERGLVRASGATVVLCPLTEAYLGDGLFEAREHLRGGGEAAVGTDANVRISAVEELRTLEYGQRLRDRKRARLASGAGLGASVWNWLARGGARAAGVRAGAIAPGHPADLVVLDAGAPVLAGRDPETALDAWLVGGTSVEIEAVYVSGERRVERGRLRGESEAAEAFRKAMSSLAGA